MSEASPSPALRIASTEETGKYHCSLGANLVKLDSVAILGEFLQPTSPWLSLGVKAGHSSCTSLRFFGHDARSVLFQQQISRHVHIPVLRAL